jgi:hypothetical protein
MGPDKKMDMSHAANLHQLAARQALEDGDSMTGLFSFQHKEDSTYGLRRTAKQRRS